jgi:alcohol dehydrogenase class IV
MWPAPHGAVCAAVLPHAMDVNVRAVRSRAPGKLARFEEVARLVTGRPGATAEDGVAWIAELVLRLEIPPLRAYGVSEGDVDALVEKASRASSMKGNAVELTREELREVISRAI